MVQTVSSLIKAMSSITSGTQIEFHHFKRRFHCFFCTMVVRCQQDLLFSSQTCCVVELDLPCFDSALLVFLFFFESNLLHIYSVLLIYWVSRSFLGRSFRLLTQSFLFYWFIESNLLLPVLSSDLIAMCTVDKIKEVGACKKRLLYYHDWKIEIVLPEKLLKIILTDKHSYSLIFCNSSFTLRKAVFISLFE